MADLQGTYKGIGFKYTEHTEDSGSGILIINHPNGIESTHIITNWSFTRVFQYIESMKNLA